MKRGIMVLFLIVTLIAINISTVFAASVELFKRFSFR